MTISPDNTRPIFREEGFDDIDDTWTHGTYIGGLAGAYEDPGLATSYFHAAHILVERGLKDESVSEVVLPALFLYRQALELRLKFAVRPRKLDHDLDGLVRELDDLLVGKRGEGLPANVVDRVKEIAKFDRRADAFRFTHKTVKRAIGDPHFADEVWVDLVRLRDEMASLDSELQSAALAVRG